VPLLRVCSFEQAPDNCFLRERCLMACVCLREGRDYYFGFRLVA